MVRTRRSDGKKFYACNNHPQCDFTINDIEDVKTKVRCPKCGGIIEKKNGKHGEFYGCKNFHSAIKCEFTLSVSEYEEQKKKFDAEIEEDEENNQFETEDYIDTINTFAPVNEDDIDDEFLF